MRSAAPRPRRVDLQPGARLAAEGIGTAFLAMAVVGSGIMAGSLTADGAVALLANTAATAGALVVLVAVLGPVSGAHLNPAVTLAFLLRGEISPVSAAAYVAVQLAGAIGGVLLAHAMFGLAVIELSAIGRTGPGQWLAEAVAAFALVTAILLGKAHRPTALPWIVGLTIASAYWFTASTAFANPALTVARGLASGMTGIRLADVPPFVAAEFLAAALAAIAAAPLVRYARR